MVHQVLQRGPRPDRPLRIPRWMRVVAHQPPVRADNGAWQRQVDLEPARMGMRGDIAHRPDAVGDAGPRQLEDQLQSQVHLSAQLRIAGVERRAVDVVRREGQDEARVFPLEGQDRQHLAQPVVPPGQDFRAGFAQDRPAPAADLLHDDGRIHVECQRQVTVGAALRAVVVMMAGERDQHSGRSASPGSSVSPAW